VLAQAYDTLVPGYGTRQVNVLRLWSSRASTEFNFQKFDEGSYSEAVVDKMQSETICKVLYPNDTTTAGKLLRMKQQYFFVSATLQDIVRDFRRDFGNHWNLFPLKVAIQLNETHPVIAIPELMRIFLDSYRHNWDEAWDRCLRVFAFTNHTALPETLERWPVRLFKPLLPRHYDIVCEINRRFLDSVNHIFPGDLALRRRISLIEEAEEKMVVMSHLAIVGSHSVNGVSQSHSTFLRDTLFHDFHVIFPGRFTNVTNGTSQRRWLLNANPGLAALITSTIGPDWVADPEQLRKLEAFENDPEFQQRWRDARMARKESFFSFLRSTSKMQLDSSSLVDIQVKKIHEYKRQLLTVLFCIARYNAIRADPTGNFVPRTVIFAGKAPLGYVMAKLIIRFILDVASVINQDPVAGDNLKIIFAKNMNVSLTEQILPSCDLSEHIPTPDLEGTGTGDVEAVLNGAVILGTRGGLNVEIGAAVGDDNIFLIGPTPQELALLRPTYNPRSFIEKSPVLSQVLEQIRSGFFCPDDRQRYSLIYDSLTQTDTYLLMADFDTYMQAQDRVDLAYTDQARWTRMSIHNVANMGHFSSDRSIREYAEKIWDLQPAPTQHGGLHSLAPSPLVSSS